jgi:hypothetical protein
MAITVIGGLTVCTFLTLFVIPAIYVVAAGWLEKKKPQAAPIEAQPAPVKTEPISAGVISDRPLQTKDMIVMPSRALEKSQVSKIDAGAEQCPSPVKESKGLYLTRRQNQLLEYIKKAGKITRKEYSDLFKISVPTAARDLKCLMDKGFLKAEGPLGPGRWYELK